MKKIIFILFTVFLNMGLQSCTPQEMQSQESQLQACCGEDDPIPPPPPPPPPNGGN